jgi:hypothetical protein
MAIYVAQMAAISGRRCCGRRALYQGRNCPTDRLAPIRALFERW